MANIFSGMFTGGRGGGGGAQSNLKYASDLKEYEDLMSYKRRNEDIAAQSGAFDEATKDMTPERQNTMKLFQMMAGGRTTGDKGMEALNKSFSQRGGTIADIAKDAMDLKSDTALAGTKHGQKLSEQQANEDAKLKRYKAEREFLLSHPNPLDRTAVAQDLELFHSLGNPDDPNEVTRKQQDFLKVKRKEQWFEQKDQHIDLYGNTIDKRLLEGGIKAALVPEYTAGIANYYDDINAMDETLYDTQTQMNMIDKLSDTADHTTVGVGSIFSVLGVTPSGEWQRDRDTLVANLGLNKILELKASSAQGATGLGALNEKELKMLQDQLINLNQANTPQEMKDRLKILKNKMQTVQDRRMRDLKKRRTWYGKNKKYDPLLDASDDDLITEDQEHLFLGNRYSIPEVAGDAGGSGEGTYNAATGEIEWQ